MTDENKTAARPDEITGGTEVKTMKIELTDTPRDCEDLAREFNKSKRAPVYPGILAIRGRSPFIPSRPSDSLEDEEPPELETVK